MGATDLLGTGWRFPPRFLNNGEKALLVSDQDDVRQSLEVLLSTSIGERLYHPDFGCDLRKFMFEETNSLLVTEIQQMIARAIYDYEPRVEIQAITVTESEEDAHVLLINIDYVIISTNNEKNLVYAFSLY